MRIMEAIGCVTLSRCHRSLNSAVWRLAVPLMLEGLSDRDSGRTEPVVVYDELNAGLGSLMAVSESAEAAAPFHPHTKPIDAYNVGILDDVSVGEP